MKLSEYKKLKQILDTECVREMQECIFKGKITKKTDSNDVPFNRYEIHLTSKGNYMFVMARVFLEVFEILPFPAIFISGIDELIIRIY